MQVLLLCEHGHHDERVQVDAFTQHPEIIAAQHVHVEEVQHLTADLQRGTGRENRRSSYLFLALHMKKKYPFSRFNSNSPDTVSAGR